MLIGGISMRSGSLQFKGKSLEKTAAMRLSRVRLKAAKGIQGGHGNAPLAGVGLAERIVCQSPDRPVGDEWEIQEDGRDSPLWSG